MATDLVGNEKLQRFIRLLSDLNHEIAEVFSTGRTEVFSRMNETVLEIHSIQQNGTEEAYTAIEEDCQIIYRNFDAIVAMLKSNESLFFDNATNTAVKKFLENMFGALLHILQSYGLVRISDMSGKIFFEYFLAAQNLRGQCIWRFSVHTVNRQ